MKTTKKQPYWQRKTTAKKPRLKLETAIKMANIHDLFGDLILPRLHDVETLN